MRHAVACPHPANRSNSHPLPLTPHRDEFPWVVIDNVADRGEAAKKGFGTGLTLGLNGTTVTDGYVCTVVYTRNGKVVETKVEHAIHSTIGNEKAPAGLAPLQPAQAVQQVMTQMMWNALNNLSQQHAFQ